MSGDERFEKIEPEKVEALRRAFWVTQDKTARRMGRTQGAFSRWEKVPSMRWDTWVVMRAEVALEAFGIASYPPPSFEELMRMFEKGLTKEDLQKPSGVPFMISLGE